MANLGVLTALAGRHGEVFGDKLNHASLVDAAQLSGANFTRYRHNDLAQLESLLAASAAQDKLIVSDLVFSMDGDTAPVDALLDLAERYDAWLYLDDAHGFGVLNDGRGGLTDRARASDRVIYLATLGKAAGVAGAAVAAHASVIDWLIQKARPYIYTTASPPLLAACLLESLRQIEAGAARRERLRSHIAQLRQGLAGLKHGSLMDSNTPIQPLLIGANADAVRAVARPCCSAACWCPRSARRRCRSTQRGCASPCRPRTARTMSRSWSRPCMPSPKPHLALVHGWGMNARVFDELAALLAADFEVRALDLPGHGGRDALADNTLQGWADDLVRQLPDNAILLGWSLGGQVAMRAALDHPHKIARLILLASTPKFVATEDWQRGMAPADLQDFGAALLAEPEMTLLRFLSLQTRGMSGQKAMLQQLRQSLLAAPAAKQRGAGGRAGDPARHRFARGIAAIGAADPGAARRARHADAAGSRCLAGRGLARTRSTSSFPVPRMRRTCRHGEEVAAAIGTLCP